MTETITTYSVEPSDDREFTFEEIQAITDGGITSGKIASELTELEQLNLKVAAIAGWENVQEWNPIPKTCKPKKVFQGTNKKYPELGIFVPDYTSDLNAIFAAFKSLDLKCSVSSGGAAWNSTKDVYAETPAIAFCKLLLELAPNLPKSEPEVQVIDDDGEIDEPTVIEAIFE